MPVWWALGLAVLTTVGLGLLTWGLIILDLLAYGMLEVMSPGAGVEPHAPSRFGLALAGGAVVNIVGAPALAVTLGRTPARAWPSVLRGLVAALLAAGAGLFTLLLVLGVDPVGFLLG